jgi:ABC-type uncharacterized transport system substrate-binding protein
MIARIFHGAKIDRQQIEFPTTHKLYVNLSAADNLGVNIPPSVLQKSIHVTASNQ